MLARDHLAQLAVSVLDVAEFFLLQDMRYTDQLDDDDDNGDNKQTPIEIRLTSSL